MNKIHVNPATGETGVCKASKSKCPFGAAEDHYATETEARAAFEKKMFANLLTTKTREPQRRTRVLGKNIKPFTHEVQVNDSWVLVENVKNGRSLATLTLSDSKTITVPLEERIAVRARMTENMRKAVQENHYNAARLKQYKPQTSQAHAAINTAVNAGHMLTETHINDLVVAEAKDAIVERYRATLNQIENVTNVAHYKAWQELSVELKQEIAKTETSSVEGLDLASRKELEIKKQFVNSGMFTSK